MESILGPTGILGMVDQAVRNYTVDTYSALSNVLAPSLKLLLIIYTAFFGIGHITGRLTLNLWDTLRHFLRLTLVVAFVTQWDFFALYIGRVLTDGPAQLLQAVSGGHEAPIRMLADVLARGVDSSYSLLQMSNLFTPGFYFVGIVIFLMTIFCVGYAVYLMVLAKLALGILLGLAPLFFLFFLFDSTREMCNQYIKQLINFALIPLFTAAVLGMMLKIPQQALTQLQKTLAAHTGHGGAEILFVLTAFFIVVGLLHQVTGFAAGISGGGLHLHPGGIPALTMAMALVAFRRSGRSFRWFRSAAQRKWSARKGQDKR